MFEIFCFFPHHYFVYFLIIAVLFQTKFTYINMIIWLFNELKKTSYMIWGCTCGCVCVGACTDERLRVCAHEYVRVYKCYSIFLQFKNISYTMTVIVIMVCGDRLISLHYISLVRSRIRDFATQSFWILQKNEMTVFRVSPKIIHFEGCWIKYIEIEFQRTDIVGNKNWTSGHKTSNERNTDWSELVSRLIII